MINTNYFKALMLTSCFLLPQALIQANEKTPIQKPTEETKSVNPNLDLRQIFPEKNQWGSKAFHTEFSHDGRYVAYLFRTKAEERHGYDLYIYDTLQAKTTRVTSALFMEQFQSSSRKVCEHRVKLAKEDKNNKDAKDNKLKMIIAAKDHEDKKAPRYAGLKDFSWSPNKNALIFSSEGELYTYNTVDARIKRLTISSAHEEHYSWLPDGSGYLYMLDGKVMRKTWLGNTEELTPKLAKGERIFGYEMSPNNKYILLMSSKSQGASQERTVKIANYRSRFMQVREVRREVTEDETHKNSYQLYIYEINDLSKENSKLHQVFTMKKDQPRDTISFPEWAADSSRVVFSAYDQGNGHVDLHQAILPATEKEKLQVTKLYSFLHVGGPNTPRMTDPFYAEDSRSVLFLSEQSGFRHLHKFNPVYKSVQQLTSGNFEVYPFDMSADRKWVYALSTKMHPARHDVFRIRISDGTMEKISKLSGRYKDVAVSPQADKVCGNYYTFGKMRTLQYFDTNTQKSTALSEEKNEKLEKLISASPHFFNYKNRQGQQIYGTMFKPDKLTPDEKPPLLIYVYGGPLGTDKMVMDGSYSADSYFFARYMAKKHGFICVTIDPRGASGYGGLFENANYKNVGKPQVEDLVDGVKWLIENHNIDATRVGIHGWSFGGFQTQMCLYTQPDVFAAGIAGAGPTEWENYNSWYSTGLVGLSKKGGKELEKFSLLPLAKNLKGRLMLVHGMEDANVLFQDTVNVYRELIKAGKGPQVDLFLDPTGGHHAGGDIKSYEKYTKYESFLLQHLSKTQE